MLIRLSNKELTIIFVNFKSSFILEKCLDSLENQTYKDFIVIIVDNTPNNKEYLKLKKFQSKYKEFFELYILKPKFNLGFAGGNNLAIRQSKSPFLLLLNCDTELEKNALKLAIDFLKKNPNVGMLTPKILFFNDPKRIWYAGAYVNPRSFYFLYHIGLNQRDAIKFNEIKETCYACGAALFTKREVVERIGLMDEIFFMYVEETDWNYRAKKIGYKIIYFPETFVLHKVEIMDKKNRFGSRENPFQMYLYNRNKIIFVIKHFSPTDILFFLIKFQFRTNFIEFCWSILHNKPEFLLAQIRSLIMGIIIGIKRRTNRNCRKLLKIEMNYIYKLNVINIKTKNI